jgi:hypothetical protein
MIAKLVFWLTVHRQCAWCKTYLHRAPLPLRTSHGICGRCSAEFLNSTKPIAGDPKLKFVLMRASNSFWRGDGGRGRHRARWILRSVAGC